VGSMQLDQRKWLKLLILGSTWVQRLILWSICVLLTFDLAVLVMIILPANWKPDLSSFTSIGRPAVPFPIFVVCYANGFLFFVAGPAWFAFFLLRACLSFLFSAQYSLRNLVLFQMVVFLLVGLVFFGNESTASAGWGIAFFLFISGALWLWNHGYWLTICRSTGELKCFPPILGRGKKRTATPSAAGPECHRLSSPDHA
jgi:hypothetical protein